MKKTIIFGTGSQAIRLYQTMEQEGMDMPSSFVVNRRYIQETTLYDVPVLPFEDMENLVPPEEYDVYLAVGYSKMNNNRMNIANELLKKGYSLLNFIHPKAEVWTKQIGYGNIIMSSVYCDANCRIGNCNIMDGGHVNIGHDDIVGDYNFFGSFSFLAGYVTVKNNCFFGIKSTVGDHSVVESYTLVGAGAYINGRTKEGSVYVAPKSMRIKGIDSRTNELM